MNLAGVQRLLAVAEGLQRLEPLLDDPALGRAEAAAPAGARSAAAQGGRGAVSMDFRDYYATLGVAKTAIGEGNQAGLPPAGAQAPSRRQPRRPGRRGRVQGAQRGLRGARQSRDAQEVRRARRQLAAVRTGRARRPAAPLGGRPGPAAQLPHDDARRDGGDVRRRRQPVLGLLQHVLRRPGRRRRARPRAGARGRGAAPSQVEHELALDLEAALGGRVERRDRCRRRRRPRTLEVRIPAGVTDGIAAQGRRRATCGSGCCRTRASSARAATCTTTLAGAGDDGGARRQRRGA